MATRIFDRETMLDLTVNIIPLLIIAFFIVGFLLFTPESWRAMGTLGFTIQMGLLVAPFVALAILTYLSGKAIAGDEKRSPVYLPGQAGVPGAKPLEDHGESGEELATADADTDTDGDRDADAPEELDEATATEAEPEADTDADATDD
jgi:hypothetical protein